VNQNLARAIGPAIGGLLLAATSAGTVFLANAATFLAVIAVIWWWHSTRPATALPREHVGEAIRAGGRYVAASPVPTRVVEQFVVASWQEHLLQQPRITVRDQRRSAGILSGHQQSRPHHLPRWLRLVHPSTPNGLSSQSGTRACPRSATRRSR